MPDKNISKKRAKLLVELEYLVGRFCYNGSIQNWGPGGAFYGEGREFRYPLTCIDEAGNKQKIKHKADSDQPSIALTGYYAFGANQLQIMMALDAVVCHIEQHYDLKV